MKTLTMVLVLAVATIAHSAQMQYTGDGGGGRANVSFTCQPDGSGRFSYISVAGSINDGTAELEGSGSGVIGVNKKTGASYAKSSSGEWTQRDFFEPFLVWEGSYKSAGAGPSGNTRCLILEDEEHNGIPHVTGFDMRFDQCGTFKVTGEDADGNTFTDSGKTCTEIFACDWVGNSSPDGTGNPVPCHSGGWAYTEWK